jgi:penicillin-binding protein 2
LLGESKGLLPTPLWKEEIKKESWFIGDTYNLSIGQGDLLVTPLQVAMATAAIANGGILYRPLIVKEVLDPISGERQIIDKRVLTSNTIKPYNISIVKAGMRECVMRGSCIGFYMPQIITGGKTGTAQWSSNRPNHAWFTGFAPYSNSKIAITVLIEEGGEGSAAALPVARDFLIWLVETNNL